METFELLKSYIEEIPIGLMLFDPKGNLLSWNKHALLLLEGLEDDFKKNVIGTVGTQVQEIISTEGMKEKDLVGLSKPLKLKKIIASDKNIILMISETVQESIAEMSHELRRPITNIKTLAESLLLGAKNDPDISQKFLEQINGETDRLGKLVNELINLSKIRAGKLSQAKKKINLKAKIDDAIKSIKGVADKNKTTITNEISEGYEIFADPEQIDHVVQNLIENAVKYSPEGSKVTIKTGPVPGSFQVDDTGIGIPESEVIKIFERFYRVDRTRAKGSSGLGLSIVKSVIDLHGGKIEVKSQVGSGSSFIVYLPDN
jgi:two-component system phosphate regulon sensor histidine kinase PhoR